MSKFYRNPTGFFAHLFKGSGLYWVLGATVLVVLSLSALLFLPEEETQETVAPPHTEQFSQQTQSATDTLTDASSADGSTDASSDGGTEGSGTAESVAMILPVSGSIGTDFSLTVPVFSETMQDWRVHQGIDFITEGQAEVMAAADGIVDQVYFDELMGVTVEILHADGTVSVYQSLAEEVEVIAGQEVRRGDVIGKSGTSADSESLEGCHLHFALVCGGVYLDPNDRFTS